MPTRRAKVVTIAWVLGCLVFFLPPRLSLYVAVEQGRSEARTVLDLLTSGILRRAETLRLQSDTAIERLAADGAGPACTAADLEHLRQMAASYAYLQGMGRMRGNVLLCSSLTGSGPVDLGAADRSYPLPATPRAWDRAALPGIAGTRFSVYAHGGYAAISLPELVADVTARKGITVAQFSVEDRKVMRAKGEVDPLWMAAFTGTATYFEDEQGRSVAIKPSRPGHTAAIAAMSSEQAAGYVREAAAGTLPVGLAVGVVLALAVAWRARYLLSITGRLRQALRRKEFHLVYQPVMDLRNNRCVGAEALIRWSPPGEPAVSPVVFIPVAERRGLIQEVTAQVMDLVAHDAAALIAQDPDTHIAINFSAEDLHSPQTEERLKKLLSLAGARSHNIMIEATERGLMNPDKAKAALVSVRAQGFKVAIDDFGTGNSSLSYLATYDLDVLKIDKMFVDSFEQGTPTTKVALHIIEIAHTLGLEMIAEGVETDRQRTVLRDCGVQYAQGWFFARPMPMGDLMAFMRAHNGSHAEPA
jgi:sensor c-di-GMP phosphodiesterase-like protein